MHHFVPQKPDEKRTGTSSRRRCAPEVLPPNSLEVYKKMTTTPVPAPEKEVLFCPVTGANFDIPTCHIARC